MGLYHTYLYTCHVCRVMLDLSYFDSGSYDVWIEVPRGAQGKVNEWSTARVVNTDDKAFKLHLKVPWCHH